MAVTDPSWEDIAQNRVAHERNSVQFFTEEILDEEKTAEQKQTVFKTVEFIRVICPGDASNIPVKIVDETIRRRYPKHYAAFKANLPQEGIGGTLLEAWGKLKPNRIAELKFNHIHTVEDLAGLSEGNFQNLGAGIRAEQQLAQAYLKATRETAPLAKLSADNEDLRKQNEAMAAQLAVLSARMDEQDAAKAPKQEKRKGA